ncbi:MAG: peptide chain release factor N(5)-glutamine methyltransferase [Pseudomonadota bacterium]
MAEPDFQDELTSVAAALASACAQGLDRLDAQLLLLHALEKSPHERAWLLAHDQQQLTRPQIAAYVTSTRQRLAGIPLAYIVGHQEFYGLSLRVDRRVLVPRADTETLVDWALELLGKPAAARVIDLGTGSGAIALALKSVLPQLAVSAVDRSADALAVASANAASLGLSVDFLQGSWLEPVTGEFDLILSNPPYVAPDDSHLAALHAEPLQALVAEEDGLADLRQIIESAPDHLMAGGWLLLEHGYDQADAVKALLSSRGYAQVGGRRDIAGIWRCSGGQWMG